MPMCLWTTSLQSPRWPEEDIVSLESDIGDGCEPHVGARNPDLVLCKSSYCSWPLSPLSGPLNETALHRYLAHSQSSGNVC